MRFSLNIDHPVEKMEKSKKRMEARIAFKYHDRVPVNFCIVPRYFTRVFDMEYNEIYKDAETQYYWLLQFAKYQIENIPCDYCTGTTLYVHPYFDNVTASSAFGSEIAWPHNETPQAIPTMKNVDEIEKFEIPAPDAALWGKTIEWWHKMKEFTRDTKIIFNGKEGSVQVSPLGAMSLGPHMIAIDLVGQDFYWWMIEYPEACHKLLDKITKGLIQAECHMRSIDPTPRGNGYGIAEDSSQIMSAETFKEFTVPYDKMLYDEFAPGPDDIRGMHMCGKSGHLHKSLVEDLKINSFDVFGYQVPPEAAAANMGGKVRMWGNINPMLMLGGTKAEVKSAAMEALEAIAPCGGFMLGDGANVCPGTPVENLAALTEAAEEYSRRHPGFFSK